MNILKKLFNKNKEKHKAAHLELGERGENEACNYLKKMGYQIVEKDFRCKIGQIDIIARDDNTLCFVEVKCRSSYSFGKPEEAITWRKKQRIKKISEYYMLRKRITNADIRYDAVTIYEPNNDKRQISLIKNAF
jgi:putative endonuclease